MHTLEERFPENKFYRIYTDGSLDADENSGCGVISNNFFFVKNGGKYLNIYEIELKSIYFALLKIIEHRKRIKRNIVFLVDSQAALKSLASFEPKSMIVIEIHQLLLKLENIGFKFNFQWVPSHCKIIFNELADNLAKKGCELTQKENPFSFERSKKIIDNTISKHLFKFYSINTEGKSYHQLLKIDLLNLNKKDLTANFRRLTGHDILNEHLFRFNLTTDPKCFLCKEENESSNHLLRCKMLKEERDKNKKLNLNEFQNFSKLYFLFRDLKNSTM